MRKASPEKRMFMCTNSEKISVSITKVHSESKKTNKSVAKAAPVWHPICGAQTALQTK